MHEIRIQKALATAGVASRRAAEKMLTEGRIRVNGKTIHELGTKIDPYLDEVYVDGRKVKKCFHDDDEKLYILLNKPSEVLTTAKDDRGRRTVMDLVRGATEGRIFPVGRLDYDAQGVMLLTNDGDLAHRLTHPSSHIKKTYVVKVKGNPPEDKLKKLRQGLYLEDGPTKPAELRVLGKAKLNTWVEITISEGRNRQVKRMFRRIKHSVMKIMRTDFAGLHVNDLPLGAYRQLTKKEVTKLKSL